MPAKRGPAAERACQHPGTRHAGSLVNGRPFHQDAGHAPAPAVVWDGCPFCGSLKTVALSKRITHYKTGVKSRPYVPVALLCRACGMPFNDTNPKKKDVKP